MKNEYTDACFHDDQELSELDLSYDYIKSGPGYIQRITDSHWDKTCEKTSNKID